MPRVRKKQSKQGKHWIFTINNPTEDDTPCFDKIAYMIVAQEVGKNGTPHIQGYVCFKNRQRLSAVKKIFPRAWLHIKNGSVKEAIDYCKKDGDFLEYGDVPMTASEGMTKRWDEAFECAKLGAFEEIPKDMLIRYYHAFKRINQDFPVKPADLESKDNKWIVAPTGYGKSTYARRTWPDFYDKAPNKWFVGYKGQATLLLDDFGPEQCKYLHWYIKRWADLFSFPMETKGGGTQIRPRRVVLTSQYTIEECFEDPKVVAAIKNRFEVIELEHWDI